MKINLLLLLFISMLFALNESFSQNYSAELYFPLKIGNKWLYEQHNYYSQRTDTTICEIIGKVTINGKEYFKIQSTLITSYPEKFYSSSFFRNEGGSVYVNGNDSEQVLYKFDRDTGDTWMVYNKTENLDRDFLLKQKDYTITVGGTEYKNCIYIYSDIKERTDSEFMEEFAPGIGRISFGDGLTGRWELFWHDVNLSVQDDANDEKEIIISPNPATDFLEISVGTNRVRPEQNIEIFSVIGEKVLTSATNPTPALPEGEGVKIDVSSLPIGVYFVKVGTQVGKFIKI